MTLLTTVPKPRFDTAICRVHSAGRVGYRLWVADSPIHESSRPLNNHGTKLIQNGINHQIPVTAGAPLALASAQPTLGWDKLRAKEADQMQPWSQCTKQAVNNHSDPKK